ncbi:MAG: hypothetical protein HW380_2985 [Magnetococcales bacterium]|nr:hypothetical protein [Magnetococcales bacterium]HIJ85856.1 prepilin-type N-terminal cleavage/methylation domain-containing protein [Magnetococcales bacterium]
MGIEVENPALWRRGHAGVTMMEMVIVITVIGVLSFVTMAKFMESTPEHEGDFCQGIAQSLAGCLMMDIRDAQTHAMLVNSGYSIVLKPETAHQYDILREDRTTVVKTRHFHPEVTIPAFDIIFDALGRPSWSGDIALSKSVEGQVEPQTIGIVHVEENTGAVWVAQQ